jgi:DNA-binding MarR family transcriptional regulator
MKKGYKRIVAKAEGEMETLARKHIGKTLQTDAHAVVTRCAGWNTRLAARRITQFLERAMDGAGLSVPQLGLMAQIAAAPEDSIGALARRTGLGQSTLSRNLRMLEADRLVGIAIVDRDQRRRIVWLTEAGALRLKAAIPAWRAAHAALAKRMAPELAQRLVAATEALED